MDELQYLIDTLETEIRAAKECHIYVVAISSNDAERILERLKSLQDKEDA